MGLQAEFTRNFDMIRAMDDPPEAPFSGSRPYFAGLSLENAPVSPRQMSQDARPLALGAPRSHRGNAASHLSVSPRRAYGSIGSNPGTSPGALRPQGPPPPPLPHPLSSVTSPPGYLSRRHTSADIRNVPGWQQTSSPFASGNTSSQWPSSPRMNPMSEEQHIRDSFSSYSLTNASSGRRDSSRPVTPPFSNASSLDPLSSWSWGSRDKNPTGMSKDHSGPPTRRGSMAHILNPAETAECAEEHDEDGREDDRKRKRL